jgi:hypothetical protein
LSRDITNLILNIQIRGEVIAMDLIAVNLTTQQLNFGLCRKEIRYCGSIWLLFIVLWIVRIWLCSIWVFLGI